MMNKLKKLMIIFKKMNDSKILNKQITLAENQIEGNGIFSFLLPTIVSMLPSLLSSGKGIINNFFELKTKYPDSYKRKNYPLSNIFINDLLKDNKNFSGCFSKDRIILLDNIKSLIYHLQNSNQKGSHWCSIIRKNNTIYVFDSFGIGEIPSEIYKIYKNLK